MEEFCYYIKPGEFFIFNTLRFVVKPYSVPQYEYDPSNGYGYHWCLWYHADGQLNMYSFITGEIRDLERILRDASLICVIRFNIVRDTAKKQ